MTSSARSRRLPRAAVVSGVVLVLLLLAAPASAHMTVNPREVPAGGYSKLTLRVPNESPTSGTVSVTVSLPADTPFASVKVKPHAGWDAEITRSVLPEPLIKGDREITEVVSRITWTAQPGVRVGPGEFEEFDINVGPLPKAVGRLSFPATQTYEDGKVVVWDQPQGEGDEDPEHPAPVLTVTAPAGDAAAAPGVAAVGAQTAAPVGEPSAATDTTARVLGAAGLLVGVLGIATAVATTLTHRRRPQV